MQTIPSKCTVLIVGGGPGGSFTAAILAREGIDTVILEANRFPRYHIGESMLPSLRHFLRFIELDDVFMAHGFFRKNGAAFKLNQKNREGYTDFLSAGGPQNFTWNVIRSESDDLMFRHAGKSGAKTFEGVKVTSIDFASRPMDPIDSAETISECPVSASYERKSDGKAGKIKFDYIVDASGRAGILSTKYLKNRKYNKALKNIAFWGYWTRTGSYGLGTNRAYSPYFEALKDETGWAWLIPLHDGTTSVGIVMNHSVAIARRASSEKGGDAQPLKDFYQRSLTLAPNLLQLLAGGKLASDIKSASDYSYSSSSYAIPYARIIGDAGCFIDPFFSSGVHLALTGGLSAAATICAAIRADCTENKAAKWHSEKIAEAYSRFYIVVLSAYWQMRFQDQNILSQMQEDDFDLAFDKIKPIIQGTVDVGSKISQSELTEVLNFCAAAFDHTQPEEKEHILRKFAFNRVNIIGDNLRQSTDEYEDSHSLEELRVLTHIRARDAMDTRTTFDLDNFSTDIINGMRVNLQRGELGLVHV
ncbi:hypothetical protein OIDMADRAFT_133494 [Oidiodendron maius Zn]|uniref:FAD-binding domain-containing protein n=1 Tax=Oidiodendron maius (strain Zn) TaxID=913774 RepID=A0A0C3GHG6_OIDMZ|nr:hypothetical protein OIDMADRAFT_133494 [Oidiodendron maius Zn]